MEIEVNTPAAAEGSSFMTPTADSKMVGGGDQIPHSSAGDARSQTDNISAQISPEHIEQLQRLQQACTVFYGCPEKNRRDMAHQFLLAFRADALQDVSIVPALLHLIEVSTSPHAVVFGCATLRELLEVNWVHIDSDQSQYIRLFLMDALVNFVKATRPSFVVTGLIRTLSAMFKLDWLERPDRRDALSLVSGIQSSSSNGSTNRLLCASLELLSNIVTDVQPQIGSFDYEQRRLSMMFKDQQLEKILRLGLSTLHEIVDSPPPPRSQPNLERQKVQEDALKLVLNCLSYDFPGTGYPPLSDSQPLLVPTSWKFIKHPDTLQVLFATFDSAGCASPNAHTLALQAVTWLATTKRSMFATISERRGFLKILMIGTTELLSNCGTTGSPFIQLDSVTSLARLVEMLRCSFPLTDFILQTEFDAFIAALYQFTCNSVYTDMDCSEHLFETWACMVNHGSNPSATLYSSIDRSPAASQIVKINQMALSIVNIMVDHRLTKIAQWTPSTNDIDEDDGAHVGMLRSMAFLIRPSSLEFSQFVLARLSACVTNFNFTDQATTGVSNCSRANQLGELILVISSVLSSRAQSSTQIGGGSSESYSLEESVAQKMNELDAELAATVITCMKRIDSQVVEMGAERSCTSARLEASLLTFLTSLHLLITSDGPSAIHNAQLARSIIGLLGLQSPTPNLENIDSADTYPSIALLDLIVCKVAHNLQRCSQWESLIGGSLALLNSLAYGVRIVFFSANSRLPKVFSNGRILLQSSFVRQLLHSAETDISPQKWPFLELPAFSKYRASFYQTVSRLYFLQDEPQISAHFDNFISSVSRQGEELSRQLSSFSATSWVDSTTHATRDARRLSHGLLSDVRGIIAATNRAETFDRIRLWINPRMPMFEMIASRFVNDSGVMCAMFRMLCELADNGSKRLVFGKLSSDAIVLFRWIASIVTKYTAYIGQITHQQGVTEDDDDDDDDDISPSDAYQTRYKCLGYCLVLERRLLTWQWLNFGIMAMYEDVSLNSVDQVLLILLQIPITDLLSYSKLLQSAYPFLESFCVVFPHRFISLSEPALLASMQLINLGLNTSTASDSTRSSSSFTAVGAITEYLLKVRYGGQSQAIVPREKVQAHFTSNEDWYRHLLSLALQFCLQTEQTDKWNVSVPIFNLILLLRQQSLELIKQELVSQYAQPHEHSVGEFFDLVLADVLSNTKGSSRSDLMEPRDRSMSNYGSENESIDASDQLSYDQFSGASNVDVNKIFSEFVVQCKETKGRTIDSCRTRFVDRFGAFIRRFRLTE